MEPLIELTKPNSHLVGSALVIALIALLGAGALAVVGVQVDKARENAAKLAQQRWIGAVLPRTDNSGALVATNIVNEALLGSRAPLSHYVSSDGQLNAIKWTIPNAYNGDISMAMSVDSDGRIVQLKVLEHEETPGFGAVIGIPENDWMAGFQGRSLQSSPATRWRLKSDGGVIDGISGATITSAAIVAGIERGLKYLTQVEHYSQ